MTRAQAARFCDTLDVEYCGIVIRRFPGKFPYMQGVRVGAVLLSLSIWLLVPLTVGHWGRVPHTHILVGHVTELDMAEHLAREQPQATVGHAEENLPHWENGWILSVPFGNPGALFTFLFMLGLIPAIVLFQHDSVSFLVGRNFALKQIYFAIVPPPPRTDFPGERGGF